ncbi:MAG TPA: imidazole glycerol phosphate synthase subunit HisH [Bacillota bacterium]
MITIVDYGAGNLRSVAKAFEYLGHPAVITADPLVVAKADKIVLPGVGAFGKAMVSLTQRGLTTVVKEAAVSGRPFLGICLGLQLLFEESAETFNGEETTYQGLGILPGRVLRFPRSALKIPQIGWNQLHLVRENPLFKGVANGSYVYFVHSYYVQPTDPAVITGRTDYGITYCSAVNRENLFAVQFHPEKSGAVGLKMLRNFGEL